MFSMLLPLSGNAERHLAEGALPHNGKWAALFRSGWGIVRRLFAPAH